VNENDVTVTVRYWAAARAAAGIAEEQVAARTLADLLTEIGRRHGDRDRFDDVIGICSILVGETPVGAREPAEVELAAGVSVEFLPPFAGG
jgi:molybdopterin converting factor small subunit